MAEPVAPQSLAGDVARLREQVEFLVGQVVLLAKNDTNIASVCDKLIDHTDRNRKSIDLVVAVSREQQTQIEGLALIQRLNRKAAATVTLMPPPGKLIVPGQPDIAL